jgi:hypothetical protein
MRGPRKPRQSCARSPRPSMRATAATRGAKMACEHCASPVQVEPMPATNRHTGEGCFCLRRLDSGYPTGGHVCGTTSRNGEWNDTRRPISGHSTRSTAQRSSCASCMTWTSRPMSAVRFSYPISYALRGRVQRLGISELPSPDRSARRRPCSARRVRVKSAGRTHALHPVSGAPRHCPVASVRSSRELVRDNPPPQCGLPWRRKAKPTQCPQDAD